MAATICPQCDRSIPPDTIRDEEILCPFCGWAGERATIVKTTGAASKALSDAPVEEIEFTWEQSSTRFLLSSLLLTTLFSSFLLLLFMLFALCAAVAAGAALAQVLAGLPRLAWFSGATWCFCAVVCFPLSFYLAMTSRCRRIWIKDGRLHFKLGQSEDSWSLGDCFWIRDTGMAADSWGLYFGEQRPRLTIVAGRKAIGVGFSGKAANRWTQCFDSIDLCRPPTVNWRKRASFVFVAVMAGTVAGFLIGELLPLMGGPVGGGGILGFVGGLDAVLAVGAHVGCKNKRRFGNSKPIYITTLMAVVYAALAVKVVPVWPVIAANAAIGALIGWLIARTRPRD